MERDDEKPPTSARSLGALATAASVSLLLWNFNFGFRATADQLMQTSAALSEPISNWFYDGWLAAEAQGRIGHIIVEPPQYLGAFLGDAWFYPAVCIGVLLAIVAGFAFWLQQLIGGRIAVAIISTYFALLPLGLHHWLPNAYPMQFFPLAVGLLLRLGLQASFGGWGTWWNRLLMAMLIVVSAISFELSLSLIVLMTGLEVVLLWFPRLAPRPVARSYVMWQAGIAVASIILFVWFRLLYPSSYDGNQLPIDPLSAQAVVTLLHLYNALSFDLILRSNLSAVGSIGLLAAAAIVAAGVFVAIVSFQPARGSWRIVIPFGAIVALATTYPVAANHKYIGWCLDGHECTYMDARFSLLGIVLVILFALALILTSGWARRVLAGAIGATAALTFLANAQAADADRYISSGELLAKTYICAPSEKGPDSDARLVAQLVALPISFHPQVTMADKSVYWTAYLNHLREMRGWWFCPLEKAKAQAPR